MDARDFAAAHPTLPFGTRVKVENLANGRAVVVRINDRGSFTRGRVIDVTRGAAEKLGFVRAGVARVRVTVLDGEKIELIGSCGEPRSPSVTVAAIGRPVRSPPVAVAAVDKPMPTPRRRPTAISIRFSYAFAGN